MGKSREGYEVKQAITTAQAEILSFLYTNRTWEVDSSNLQRITGHFEFQQYPNHSEPGREAKFLNLHFEGDLDPGTVMVIKCVAGVVGSMCALSQRTYNLYTAEEMEAREG